MRKYIVSGNAPLAAQMAIDASHIWHPYSAMHSALPVFHVDSAAGVRLRLSDGREIIDGMASWWCVIHGYNHPRLNGAIETQLAQMAHVMFGGLTHAPAIRLVERLVELTPSNLSAVFLSDSGSVAVEVAMKLALQYWHAAGRAHKQRFATLRNGYHGDTFGAMSVCDPVTGMHSLFSSVLAKQHFVERPGCRYGEACNDADLDPLQRLFERKHDQIAAMVLEPIVQGAGGMYFYSADYLRRVRELCDRYDILLIADEIATGFGRSGELFACEHAAIEPDIMCLGKALTGGYLSLAATLASEQVSNTIDAGSPGVFMHGPTFMGNPLACAVALESLNLLREGDWRQQVQRIERGLRAGLAPCRDLPSVREVRTLGAIGVVELHEPVDMARISNNFVEAGVWIRPFGRLVYLMPAYVMQDDDLARLCAALVEVVARQPA